MEINSNTEARAERAQRILQALRAKNETTLTEITKATKISRPTVGNIIADLEYYGIIAQRSTSTGAGRPAALYGFAPQHGFIVALDIQRDVLSTTIVPGRRHPSCHHHSGRNIGTRRTPECHLTACAKGC